MKTQILSLLACCLLLTFCKTVPVTDAPKPAEQYNTTVEAPLVSTISIPVNISISDLVTSINNKL
jgi:hypothetical protein